MVLRYLLGFTDSTITANATSTGATRDTAQIVAHPLSIQALLDINGDGVANASTDGVLIMRYLRGLRGPALVAGVPIGTFTTVDIEARISRLMP